MNKAKCTNCKRLVVLGLVPWTHEDPAPEITAEQRRAATDLEGHPLCDCDGRGECPGCQAIDLAQWPFRVRRVMPAHDRPTGRTRRNGDPIMDRCPGGAVVPDHGEGYLEVYASAILGGGCYNRAGARIVRGRAFYDPGQRHKALASVLEQEDRR